jgi:plasmid stabilization system protein ParE
MALNILWSKKADKTFDSITEYLIVEFGEITASHFIRKVYYFLDLLSKFPEMGTIEHKELGIRGFVIVKQITIFYQIRNQTIILLNFYDNRGNPAMKRF